MRKEVSVIVCIIMGLLIALPGEVMAQGGKITFGNLKVIPGITVQENYDDNIYFGNGSNNTTELKESDWITHLMPGLLFNYTLPGRGTVNAGYQGDYAYYDETDDNDWKNHKGIFGFDYEAPGGLILGLDNTYAKASDPFGSDNQYKLGVPQTKRWSDTMKSKVGFNFSNNLKAFGYYNYYKQDFKLDQDYTQNYNSDEFGLGVQMRVMPKTWAFVRYHYGVRDYTSHPATSNLRDANDADFSWNRVNTGLTWDTEAKLSGELNLGYQWKSYDNTFDPNGNRYDARDSWIAATSISYKATTSTTFTLSVTRAVRDSGADSSEYYDDTGFALGVIQTLYSKFTLTATGAYSKNEYNLPVINKKDQDNYLGNIGLDYKIQDWLSAGVGYTYMKKDSNYITDEYTDNQFLVSLRAMY